MKRGPSSPESRKTSRWLFSLVLAVFIIWAFAWIFTYEPEHDEVEHWHAAWLMHQGQLPFKDFFEHHAPFFWNLLRLYYHIAGENFSIIPVSRIFILIVFLFTAWLSYSISRHFSSPEGSWIAALGFPLYSLSLLHAHLFVRGDPVILLLLMFSLWLAVKVNSKAAWKQKDYPLLLVIFICLGFALAISPRAGIPVITLFILLFYFAVRSIPVHRALALFFIGSILIVTPTALQALIYEPGLFYYWVYRFSATLFPAFSPLGNLLHLGLAAFPVWILVLFFLITYVRHSDLRRQRGLTLMVIMGCVNFLGLWASNRPYMQHFLMTIPFIGLLTGIGYDRGIQYFHDKFRLPRWNWSALLLIVGMLILVGKSYRLWTGGGLESRSQWTDRAEWLLKQTEGEATCASGTAYFSPILQKDAFYYWFGGRYATPTLKRLQPDFQPYTLEDLQEARPAVIHESFFEAWGILKSSATTTWLEEYYEPTPFKRYWVRKE